MQSFPNIPALRSHLDLQVGFLNELSQKFIDTLRSVSLANMRLSQQLLQDAIDTGRAMLNCATPMEFSPAALRQAGPVSQHLREHQQALLQILSGTPAEARVAETDDHDGARH